MSRMKEPLISVVVPAYNAEQWMEACCHSVCEQSYSNLELIIVDDGSQDETLKIAQEAATRDSRIRVIHTENGGVCRARNVGIDASSGEYITFLDADDELLPDALEILYNSLTQKNADIACGWATAVRPNNAKTQTYNPIEQKMWYGTEALVNSLQDHPATYAVWGKLYRKSILSDVRFVEGKKVHEDSYFVFQCFLKEPTVVINNECIIYRNLCENSASRAPFSEKFFDILFFAERKKEQIREQYPEFEPQTNLTMIKANMALLQNLCKTYEPQYRSAEKECIRAIILNKEYFTPATRANEKWFWVITHRMYWLYKLVFHLRSNIRAVKNRGCR